MKSNFLLVGGDLRMLYAAQKLSSLYNVYVYGFDAAEVSAEEHILREPPAERYDYIVLPLPSSVDGKTVNAPYSEREITLESVIRLADKAVFCGKACAEAQRLCDESRLPLYDYFTREELTVRNALITAEGALEILLRESAATVSGSRILLTGFGRISKLLLPRLIALGASVTVAARKCEQLAWAESMGAEAVCIRALTPRMKNFDMIVNTVPARILNDEMRSEIRRDCLVVDLASKAGLDMQTARESGLKVIWALSLPRENEDGNVITVWLRGFSQGACFSQEKYLPEAHTLSERLLYLENFINISIKLLTFSVHCSIISYIYI